MTHDLSLVEEARAAQARADYQPDIWFPVELKAMTKLWQGIDEPPNATPSCFFFSEEDARHARGSYVGSVPHAFARTLWRLAQVRPHLEHGFRDGIREFVIDIDAPAAMSVCAANPSFGIGSVVQYYLRGCHRLMHATGREHRFHATAEW